MKKTKKYQQGGTALELDQFNRNKSLKWIPSDSKTNITYKTLEDKNFIDKLKQDKALERNIFTREDYENFNNQTLPLEHPLNNMLKGYRKQVLEEFKKSPDLQSIDATLTDLRRIPQMVVNGKKQGQLGNDEMFEIIGRGYNNAKPVGLGTSTKIASGIKPKEVKKLNPTASIFKTIYEKDSSGKVKAKSIPVNDPRLTNSGYIPSQKNGGIITDNMGQWKHPGKVTKINSNNITMKGVKYPVLGISDTGHKQMMLPDQDYTFNGSSVTEYPMGKSGIHIKKENRGLLHKNLGVPKGEKIPASKLKIKESDSPAVKKRKQFAINAKKWHKGQYGDNLPLGSSNPPIDGSTIYPLDNSYQSQGVFDMYGNQVQQYIPQGNKQGFGAKMFNKVGGWGGIAQGAGNIASGAAMGDQQIEGGPSTAQNVVGQFGPWGKAISTVSQFATRTLNKSDNEVLGGITNTIFDPGSAWTNKDLSTKDRILGGINPFYGGMKAAKARKIRKEQGKKVKKLITQAQKSESLNQDNRMYTRPEDLIVDPNSTMPTYGTGTNYLKNGGKLAMGGELKTHWGGKAQPVSYNPYMPDMGESVEFIGNSHSESDGTGKTGIGISFGKNMVEVEQGEPAMKLQNGGEAESLVVFGDMKIPSYGLSELNDPKAKGKKFKSYIKDLNKEEVKNSKIIDKKLISASENPLATSFDKLKLNTDKVMLTGADMHLKNIASKKQIAANVQNAILDTANEFGLKSDELAKGNFIKAKKSDIAQNGKRVTPKFAGNASEYYSQSRANYESVIPSIDDSVEQSAAPANKSQKNNWFDMASGIYNQVLPYIRPTNNLELGDEQLAGERYALATNQLEGVQAQKYIPQLEQSFDISLQDQLNANQADFNALVKVNQNNPAVQATLAAQKYAANSSVLGEQFRLNQSNKMSTYNKNREILNDATLKNLAILDQQYQRQTQAKANTKAIAKSALESIGNKIAQNKLENRILDIDQQRYNYRFGPNGVAYNLNPIQQFNIPQVGSNLYEIDENGNMVQTHETVENRDSKGRIINTQTKNKTTKKSSNGSIIKSFKSY